MKSYFELMASYNQCMNKSIYEAAAKLSARELAKNRDAFFGSIMGTLNHLLVGDVIWLQRFGSHKADLHSLEYLRAMKAPKSLDAVLFNDMGALAETRTIIDKVIVEFTSELTDQIIASVLEYRNTKGDLYKKNFGYLIQHFFNHQTHHRGQMSTLLCQAGVDIGVTDLLAMISDEKWV